MKAPHIKLSFYLCLLLFIESSIAQERNPTKYPYDGVQDISRMEPWIEFVPLNFKEDAIFAGEEFHKDAHFRNAKFYHVADFSRTEFDGDANFRNATFDGDAYFGYTTFDGDANFRNATFEGDAGFFYATFYGDAHFFDATFYGDVDFENDTFDVDASFDFATFGSTANFRDATFDGDASFFNATFDGDADFRDAIFHKEADFLGTIFDSDADFSWVKFDSIANFKRASFAYNTFFTGAVFKEEVNFSWATFKEGTDFRQANFDSVKVIYLEEIKFPDGKLSFYWKQFKGIDSLRIKLDKPYNDSLKDANYTRIEKIYKMLRDNFIAQNDESSADDVMYELGWQRKEILKEFHWWLYGILFGYGYQPWRFLLFVLLPIILFFAAIWYWYYYPTLVFIKSDLFPESIQIGSKERYLIKIGNFKLLKMRISDFTKVPVTMNPLTRYWHALHFSTSVLLGIRFQKDWMKVFPKDMLGRKSYIRLVTFEWALGIILFVVFALLVKGIRFSFIKDLLGF